MNCKYCKKDGVPDGALFCPWCGEKLVRARKKKDTPKYPKFRVLSDGTLLGQIMLDGRRETVKASNEAEYKAKIDGLRTGVLELKAHPDKRPLEKVLREYIDKNDAVLSPATVRGYEVILRNRFKTYMKQPIGQIDYQKMVNTEAKDSAAKTVKNAWALVSAAFRDAKIPVPDVNLPKVPESDEDFLDYEQIQTFLKAIRGDSCEAAALLLLHSLRMSEALKLDVKADIADGKIYVRGAVVPDKDNKLVEKKTNKNRTSRREIPIMIPRLLEVLPAEGKAVTVWSSTVSKHVIKACEKAGLPPCSPHDLRRSFASLAYHLRWSERTLQELGGWGDIGTVHRFYVKLAKKDVSADVEKMKNYYGITTDSQKADS